MGMADYKVCTSPAVLSTLGLGSCLGVALYDQGSDMCGLAHVMLPDSTRMNSEVNRCKFADTCLLDMKKELIGKGADPSRLAAKIAGGARMFSFISDNSMLNIGDQTIEWNIPILASDVGKNYSRSIYFDSSSKMLRIRAVGMGEYSI